MEKKKKFVKKLIISRRRLASFTLFEKDSCDVRKLLTLVNALEFHTLYESERLCWQRFRSQYFWEIDCQKADEKCFKNNFRVSREVFNKLCELLNGLQKSNTNMREAIPLEKRVAIGLYTLGSSAEYRTIANMFGVGKSTVCKILLQFCNEVWRILAPIYLKNFPLTREKIEVLCQEFEILGFPQCIGALDGCHIEVHPSKEDATDYYNYKGWYSVVLLALVDARCRFIYVSCGSPGRCNDSQIFEGSSLKQQLNECSHLKEVKRNILGVEVPALIIGDSAFKLSDKLMKPYPFQLSQDLEQKCFNYALSKSRRVVENAFGHLKARFRRIGKGIDNALKYANAVILSCCALHNFLSEHNDAVNDKWLKALQSVEANRSYPEEITILADQSSGHNGEEIRNAISIYLSQKNCCNEEDNLYNIDEANSFLNVEEEYTFPSGETACNFQDIN
ncbi:putative nuclease HARBI1 [Musca domestica]|uniref:Nuclease HARBI1 n=1 Tax=Musca domestica TaxID=7370 RepID=A0ABM3V4G5_MUSDO|nr:putative nuclease HARBI1 [Musca domestica]